MDFKSIILIITAFLDFFLGIFVFLKNKKNFINIFYALIALSTVNWAFGIAIIYLLSSSNLGGIFLWYKFLYFWGSMSITAFLCFSLTFPFRFWKEKYRFLWFFLPNFIILLMLVFSSVMLKDSFVAENNRGVFLGSGYILFFLQFFVYMSWGYFVLLKKYFKSTGIEKSQLLYVLIGTLPPGFSAMIFNILLPTFGNFRFIWIGPIFLLAMLVSFAYAIVRYRLMDITLIIRKGFVYTVLLGVSLTTYGIAVFVVGKFLEEAFEINPFLIGALVVLVILFSAEWLKRFIQNYTDKIFFKKRINLQKVLYELSKIIVSTLDLDQLLDKLTSRINKALKTKFSGFFLFDQEENLFFLKKSAPSDALPSIAALSNALKKYKKIFILEEIQMKIADHQPFEETKRLQFLRKELEEKNIALFGPILVRDEVIGILVLGQKFSQDMFTQEEVNFLEIVLGQLGTSIENAKLYKKVQDLNKELIIKIAQATKELREANLELQRLDEAKSDFLSIASHQLRSPLAGIKGYLSMFLEGDFGEISQRQKETLKEVLIQTEKMIQLVQRFLNISRIESGKMILEKKPCQIEELIEEQLRGFRPEIEKKNLVLEFLKPEAPLPKINLDYEDIKLVLQNLIDNALLYTEKGKIVVEAKKVDQEIEVSVSDTGVGLDQEDFSRLFKKFSRIEKGKRIYVQGAGLGLYLAKRIIEAHQGKIWVESKEPGRGSKFAFRISFSP